ncbi:exo-alpha-sialidase [Deinococcus roseus]|uniref:Exo-alpha-sialidase n=1 Tax=Deinococcus roseus TaxID=392414 RepID=A0ABQ2D5U4_9DEIO|nr:exo-alpha-sialidase [Deinococcus roseus]GGJ47269.1 hypothetical protein GCM10008938_36610 [Deinococcus roseus]
MSAIKQQFFKAVRGVTFALLLSPVAFAETPANTPLGSPDLGSQMYPRLIRLAHSGEKNGTLLATFDSWAPDSVAPIFQSTDDGQTWNELSRFSHRDGCCSTLYELPSSFGDNPEGTLFWATSYQNIMESGIELWRSLDHGKSWNCYSIPVRGNTGLWEPEFAVNSAGQLQMYYSSEEHKADGFNQSLVVLTSKDGKTFSDEKTVVGMPDFVQRPGMPIVRQGSSGTFYLVYEICGTGCDVYFRTSKDGSDWGNPEDPGTRIVSDGKFFRHAPNFTVSNTEAGDTLYMIGQTYHNPDGTLASNNGQVLLIGEKGGTGNWTEHPAPVQTPDPKGDLENPYDFTNYSSPLLLSQDGKALLGLGMKQQAIGLYKMFFGRTML